MGLSATLPAVQEDDQAGGRLAMTIVVPLQPHALRGSQYLCTGRGEHIATTAGHDSFADAGTCDDRLDVPVAQASRWREASCSTGGRHGRDDPHLTFILAAM